MGTSPHSPGTSLFMVVEVHASERIRCQAPGCHMSVYKRIHVVRDAEKIVAVGSDCWARLYAHRTAAGSTARFGTSEGRLLTAEERAVLATNTAAFVSRMEAEAAAADAERAAHEARVADERRRKVGLETERRREEQRLTNLKAPWIAPATTSKPPPAMAGVPNPLQRYRAQQAALAARAAIARLPALVMFQIERVEQAMVDAKADYLAEGFKLDVPGARELIEARALELLGRSPP